MTESPEILSIIHVSDIDEFLAARFLEGGGGPLSFSVRREGRDGGIFVSGTDTAPGPGGGEGVDFELSTCECRGLDPDDVAVYIGRPVYTSSAYEFFDFILGYLSSFDCLVEFTGNAWSIRVVNAVRE
ncbi:MAG: hypothetical protein ACREOP_02510 [Thermodesulfobacteriota bacterium]